MQTLPSSAVPQAESIERVLEYAVLSHHEQLAVRDLVFSGRDALYYRSAAAALGLIDTFGKSTISEADMSEIRDDPHLFLQARLRGSDVASAWERWKQRAIWDATEGELAAFLTANTQVPGDAIGPRSRVLASWVEFLRPVDWAPVEIAEVIEVQVEAPVAPAIEWAETTEGQRGQLFCTTIFEAEFSNRTTNALQRAGLQNIAEVVALGREGLTDLKGFGRKCERELDDFLAARGTRETLEVLRSALVEGSFDWVDSAGPRPEAEAHAAKPGATGAWDLLQTSLPQHLLDADVDVAELPTRMANHCDHNDIQTIGQLVAIPFSDLRSTKNLGCGSLQKSLASISGLAEKYPTPEHLAISAPAVGATGVDPRETRDVAELWHRKLEMLDERTRMVLIQRSGVDEPGRTLEEIAAQLDITRERVRQIEKKGLAKISLDRGWLDFVLGRIDEARAPHSWVLLSSLDDDEWFESFVDAPQFARYFVERLVGARWQLCDLAEGEWVLIPPTARAPRDVLTLIRGALRKHEWPDEYGRFEGLVRALLRDDEAELDGLFIERARTEVMLDDELDPARVLAVGNTRKAKIEAFIRASEEPVSVKEIERRFGRGTIPDDVVFVRRGWVAHPSNIEGFALWQKRLVPQARRVMEREGPERQWMTGDLLEALKQQSNVPDWVSPILLAGMMRHAGGFDDLGRQRFALEGASDGSRVELVPTMRAIVEAHGAPMPKDELRAALEKKTTILDGSFSMMCTTPPMFPVEGNLVGLIERDLPGGVEAIEDAKGLLVDELVARGRGLTFFEGLQFLRSEDSRYEAWPTTAVGVVARTSPEIISNRAGLGLRAWGEPRVPTFADHMREGLEAGDGVFPVADFLALVRATRGESPNRLTLAGTAHQSGARLRGDYFVLAELADSFVPPETTPAAVVEAATPVVEPAEAEANEPDDEPTPPALALDSPDAVPKPAGFPSLLDLRIPREARGLFAKLAQEGIGDWDRLLARCQRHAQSFSELLSSNEFLPVEDAANLATGMPKLLAVARGKQDKVAERLVWIVGRYFEISDDGEMDYAIGGLDDDVMVFNRVAEWLGAAELVLELS